MRTSLLSMLSIGLVGLGITTARADHADFALLDMESTVGDVSVQAGATGGSQNHLRPTAFTVHITMTNRADLGGSNGFVRVTYADTDFVEYAIAAGATLQMTLAGGGTTNVDDIITVTGTHGAVLIGQISLITDSGRPHPGLPLGNPRVAQGAHGKNYCSTTPKP